MTRKKAVWLSLLSVTSSSSCAIGGYARERSDELSLVCRTLLASNGLVIDIDLDNGQSELKFDAGLELVPPIILTQ
jgi:hypothetical protein